MGLRKINNAIITVRDKYGNIKQQEVANIVVNVGLTEVARLMCTGGRVFSYIELGTSSATPAAGDTQLTAWFTSRARATKAVSGFSANWTHTWTQTEFSKSGIKEAGIFNRSTNNETIMLAHLTFSAVNKTNSDTLTIDWKVGAQDDGA